MHLVELLGGAGTYLETCYKQQRPRGWCVTRGNLYTSMPEEKTRVASDWGWGFCSTDCTVPTNYGRVLRETRAAVLNSHFCGQMVSSHLPANTSQYQFPPRVLCVGHNHSLHYEVWATDDESDERAEWRLLSSQFLQRSAPGLTAQIYRASGLDPDEDEHYVASAGACNGDSGGPLFRDRLTGGFVLLGLTSGGRAGGNGDCGGTNNPTIFTRMRGKAADWVTSYVHQQGEQICVEN